MIRQMEGVNSRGSHHACSVLGAGDVTQEEAAVAAGDGGGQE